MRASGAWTRACAVLSTTSSALVACDSHRGRCSPLLRAPIGTSSGFIRRIVTAAPSTLPTTRDDSGTSSQTGILLVGAPILRRERSGRGPGRSERAGPVDVRTPEFLPMSHTHADAAQSQMPDPAAQEDVPPGRPLVPHCARNPRPCRAETNPFGRPLLPRAGHTLRVVRSRRGSSAAARRAATAGSWS
jgi:hypothetical protein